MSRTRKIADTAILIAIGIVLNLATLPSIDYLGRISFVYSFCYLAGIFLGPVFGMLAAVLADILAFLILPSGPFVWQITATNGIMALVTGLCYKFLKWKIKETRIIPAAVFSFIFLTLGLSAWGEAVTLFDIFPYTLAKSLGRSLNLSSPYLMIAAAKAITQPFWIIVNIIISIVVLRRVSYSQKQFTSSMEVLRAEVEGSKKES